MRNSVPKTSQSAIIIPMPPDPEKKIVPAVEPPKVYLPACGALCDIFWWARRSSPGEEPAPAATSLAAKK
jgi:hypothetical protein